MKKSKCESDLMVGPGIANNPVMLHDIWTIGHSNRSIDELLHLLTGADIELLADVRRYPGSRKHPHFNRDALAQSLAERHVDYRHFEDLGGRRSTRLDDSPNTAWRVDSFNRYADYMTTPPFAEALTELIGLAEGRRTAIMCSEAVPWRCHRRLIADALIVRGWQVYDIMGPGAPKPHAMTEFAKWSGGQLSYPCLL